MLLSMLIGPVGTEDNEPALGVALRWAKYKHPRRNGSRWTRP